MIVTKQRISNLPTINDVSQLSVEDMFLVSDRYYSLSARIEFFEDIRRITNKILRIPDTVEKVIELKNKLKMLSDKFNITEDMKTARNMVSVLKQILQYVEVKDEKIIVLSSAFMSRNTNFGVLSSIIGDIPTLSNLTYNKYEVNSYVNDINLKVENEIVEKIDSDLTNIVSVITYYDENNGYKSSELVVNGRKYTIYCPEYYDLALNTTNVQKSNINLRYIRYEDGKYDEIDQISTVFDRKILKNTNISVDLSTSSGYVLSRWSDGTQSKSINFNVNGKTSLSAIVEPIRYSITYNLNGGENDKKNPSQYTIEDYVKFYDASKDGFAFVGWIDENGNAISALQKGSQGNKTITSRFEGRSIWFYDNDDNKYVYTIADTTGNIQYLILDGQTTKINSPYKDDIGDRQNLKSVDVNERGVSSIGDYSFYNCGNLISANFSNIDKIGDYSFFGCSSLTSIHADTTSCIGEHSFEYCSSLTNIDLPNVISAGSHAFHGDGNLTSINLKNVKTTFGHVFDGCSGIVSLQFDKLGTYGGKIGDYDFANCSSLTSIQFDDVYNMECEHPFSCDVNLMKLILRNININNIPKIKNRDENDAFVSCHIPISIIVDDEDVLDNLSADDNWKSYTSLCADADYLKFFALNKFLCTTNGDRIRTTDEDDIMIS